MEIIIAENAGFCFGVKRAMDLVWKEIVESNGKNIYALGPLIHNKQVVQRFEENGLVTLDEITEVPEESKMIIRSHGVEKKIYDKADEKNIQIIDTTCPYVRKIHFIVKDHFDKGYQIILIGDKTHPEVIGINGWCDNKAIIINSLEQVSGLKLENSKKYCIVAQTTFNLNLYEEIIAQIENKVENKQFFNTICSATRTRQNSARELSKDVDAMIVIGGKHSSNTQKLVKISKELIPTFAVETKDELEEIDFSNFEKVGITAGASTPDWIIEEVIQYLKDKTK
ncbi:MAG: 4-hydroxy-3-methylbut-2-enyl diphosphate reductase [Clostridioides sp.]|nr:4-hydroxy-3-methylbut-2-enyl diphosphate reductase [Clostridioides sp.]